MLNYKFTEGEILDYNYDWSPFGWEKCKVNRTLDEMIELWVQSYAYQGGEELKWVNPTLQHYKLAPHNKMMQRFDIWEINWIKNEIDA